MDKSECSHIGTLVKLYGYRGGFVCALESYIGEEIENWESVFIEFDGLLVPFFIDTVSFTADTTAVISFDDILSEDRARMFLQCKVYQLNGLLSGATAQSQSDIVGYEVWDQTEGYVGSVQEILEYSQNHLFRLLKGEKELLIPIADEIIKRVDHREKKIMIALPDGLLELNS